MPTTEQLIDKELGITDTSHARQWDNVEFAIDKELGIDPMPDVSFEEKKSYVKDMLQLSDEMELPYRRVIDEYDEIQRQKKEFPFGKLEPGPVEFGARKLFRNLYSKKSSISSIFNILLRCTFPKAK